MFVTAEGTIVRSEWPGSTVRRGRRAGDAGKDSPGTPAFAGAGSGRSCFLHGESRRVPREQTQACRRRCAGAGAKRQRNRGTAKRRKTKRDGRGSKKSESADSTDEAGEAAPSDPAEGSGGSVEDAFRGIDDQDSELGFHLNATRKASGPTRRVSEDAGRFPSRSKPQPRSRMREFRTSGSVGAAGE